MPNNQNDLTGQVFYDLTVIEKVGTTHYGHIWRCKCVCGQETTAYSAKLKTGKNKSCGCRKFGARHYKYSGHKGLAGCFWTRVKGHAKTRNISLDITIEQAWDKFVEQNFRCALSGEPITLPSNTQEFLSANCTASLDRIDSSKGYALDNIQWVHKDVNLIKMDMDKNNFVFWCQKVAAFQSRVSKLNKTSRKRWTAREKVVKQ